MRDEERIIKFIRKTGRPVSTETIKIFSGVDHRDANERLNSLQKWKKIRKIGTYKVDFWDIF